MEKALGIRHGWAPVRPVFLAPNLEVHIWRFKVDLVTRWAQGRNGRNEGAWAIRHCLHRPDRRQTS